MTLVKRPFAETFTFSRNIDAFYRNASGALVLAPWDVPRFDHDPDKKPRGLLVEQGPRPGTHDAIRTVAGWDDGVTKAMVLHEYEHDNVIRRAAFYTTQAKAFADACLRLAVHHRKIVVLDGWKRNRGGYVRYEGQRWYLGGALAINSGPLEAPVFSDLAERPLIES